MEDPIEYPTYPEILLHDLWCDSLDAGRLVEQSFSIFRRRLGPRVHLCLFQLVTPAWSIFA